MRLFFTLISILLIVTTNAQNLTGIWRGTFVNASSKTDIFGRTIKDESIYRFEVQIHNLASNAIEGVTYSYQDKRFYGKATMQGLFMKKTKNLIIKELKLVEVEKEANTDACPMTCYLEYKKEGNIEYLLGTYSSVTERNDKKDCGNGTVKLQRVFTTEFVKEPFLLPKPTNPTAPNSTAKTTTPSLVNGKPVAKPSFKPGAEAFMVNNNTAKQNTVKPDTLASNFTQPTIDIKRELPKKELAIPVPKVLEERKNIVAHKLVVDDNKATIEFVDNGQIDNDSISVYANNKPLIQKQKLTYKPITIELTIDTTKGFTEFIVVAENLGIIPPNTAMVTITSGSKKYEVFIEANEQKNAAIVLEYKPLAK
jgi:hypothetical protein